MIEEDPKAKNPNNFSKNDFLSNWKESTIKFEINEKEETFTNAEQLFMAFKAEHHKNTRIMNQIIGLTISSRNNYEIARDAKGLTGEKSKLIIKSEWNKVAPIYMKIALLQKFIQNDELRRKLLATEKQILIEASHDDGIWGANASRNTIISNIENNNQKMYNGDNKLGVLLMHVRDLIKYPDKLITEFLTGNSDKLLAVS